MLKKQFTRSGLTPNTDLIEMKCCNSGEHSDQQHYYCLAFNVPLRIDEAKITDATNDRTSVTVKVVKTDGTSQNYNVSLTNHIGTLSNVGDVIFIYFKGEKYHTSSCYFQLIKGKYVN